MKKILIVLVVVLSIVAVIINGIEFDFEQVILDSEGNYISEYAWMKSEEWDSLDVSQSRFSSPNEFLIEVDNCVEEISELIYREEWVDELKTLSQEDFRNKIEVKFTYDTTSRAFGGGTIDSDVYIKPLIKLNRYRMENNIDPLVHELTHIISPYTKSFTFSEGVACYIHDLIGSTDIYPNGPEPINQLISESYDPKYDYLIDYLGNTSNGSNTLYTSNKDVRWTYYAYSSSLTHYLVEKYGMGKYMELYISDFENETFVELFGDTRESILLNWKGTLDIVE